MICAARWSRCSVRRTRRRLTAGTTSCRSRRPADAAAIRPCGHRGRDHSATISSLGPLGAGGMGEVFRARDMRLDRDVALKTLSPDLYRGSRIPGTSAPRSPLTRRGQSSQRRHLHAIEEVDGKVALVMELVEGETLAKRLARPRPRHRGSRACDADPAAVEAAHRKSVVHRDLKPGNVMLARGGRVKVVDFGLARRGSTRAVAPSGRPARWHSLPAAQCSALRVHVARAGPRRRVDRRSDIFSFGASSTKWCPGPRHLVVLRPRKDSLPFSAMNRPHSNRHPRKFQSAWCE